MEGEIWYRHGDVRRGEVFCALCDSFYHYPEGLPHFMAGEGYFGNHFANDFDKEAEGNLWTLCFDCNRGKAAKTLDGIIKK